MVTKRKSSGEPKENGEGAASTNRSEPRPTTGKYDEVPKSRGAKPSVASAKMAKPKPETKPKTNAKPKSKSSTGPSASARSGASGKISSSDGSDKVAQPDDSLQSDDSDNRADPSRHRTRKVQKTRKRWPFVVVSVVLLAVLTCVGVFSWDRWQRYDDAADLQGEWQVSGSTTVVVIDDKFIKLTDDVAYAYELDTAAKTISFSLGTMEGQGRYRFSLDRSHLVIIDGEGYSGLSTLLDDVGWLFEQVVCTISGQPQEQTAGGDNTTSLDRLSHDASALPREGAPVNAPEIGLVATGEEQSTDADTVNTGGSDATNAVSDDINNAAVDGSDAARATVEDGTDADTDEDASLSSTTSGGVFDVNDIPA